MNPVHRPPADESLPTETAFRCNQQVANLIKPSRSKVLDREIVEAITKERAKVVELAST